MRYSGISLAIVLIILGILLASCSEQRITSYEQGVAHLNALQAKYGADMERSPAGADSISSLSAEIVSLKRKATENEGTKPLLLLLDYRISLLEADRLLIEGFKWGAASTTEPGFGCKKGSERILNSSQLRNQSATAGFEAITALQQLIEQYPEKAAALNLTQRTVLTLSVNYAVVQKQAEKDHRVVMGFCFGDNAAAQAVQESEGIAADGTGDIPPL